MEKQTTIRRYAAARTVAYLFLDVHCLAEILLRPRQESLQVGALDVGMALLDLVHQSQVPSQETAQGLGSGPPEVPGLIPGALQEVNGMACITDGGRPTRAFLASNRRNVPQILSPPRSRHPPPVLCCLCR